MILKFKVSTLKLEVLLRAASRHDSIEHTCQLLEGVPTGNDVRYHLDKLRDMKTLETQVNGLLQARLPANIVNYKQRLAIDLHLIPYYGEPSDAELPYIYRSAAKAGTTRFYAYATVYVIRHQQRVTLAIHAVPADETLVATLTWLLDKLSSIQVKVQRLYLDRGFYSVPVIRWLQRLNLPFIMPAVIRGKTGGTRALCTGRCSYRTHYCLKSNHHGRVTCQMAVVCRYRKGKRGTHGMDYLLYVTHRVTTALPHIAVHYSECFGIETSYRMKNRCRVRTTSKNPVLRLLLVAMAFAIVNLRVWLLWQFVSVKRRGGRQVYPQRFRLKTLLEFICHAIERHFPVIQQVYLPAI